MFLDLVTVPYGRIVTLNVMQISDIIDHRTWDGQDCTAVYMQNGRKYLIDCDPFYLSMRVKQEIKDE